MTNSKVAFTTLGCKVNTYETEKLAALFEERGYKIVEFDEPADVYVVNTCTVTGVGDKKSRQMLRKARRTNENAVVIACGCYSQVASKEILDMDEVNIVVGTKDRGRMVDILDDYLADNGKLNLVSEFSDKADYEEISAQGGTSSRTRAYLKIQDGCRSFCAYCIIPYARGPLRSRRQEDILAEAQRLSDSGYKEIVLAGINVTSYGVDTGTNLNSLLPLVHDVEGLKRLRFSSLEPGFVDEAFIETLSRLDKVCDHFHLSLQSGSDDVLRAMNRRYTTEGYSRAVSLLRSVYPEASITTDVIVGFPGETDKHFEETKAFISRQQLSRLHVFPFSAKKGTAAFSLPDQLPKHIKEARGADLQKLSRKLEEQYQDKFTGRQMSVLFEAQVKPGVYEGLTTNYLRAQTNSSKSIVNEIRMVKYAPINDETSVLQ